MMLTAVIEELMGDLRKLWIKKEEEVEESVAGFKKNHEEKIPFTLQRTGQGQNTTITQKNFSLFF